MPKLKSKSSAKKRFRRTATGKLRMSAAYKRHNLRKRSQKMKRKARDGGVLSRADARIVAKFLPYARGK
ncbi:MAG: 50S ribosomal protein L35 [Alphaproteobacteria bacterium]